MRCKDKDLKLTDRFEKKPILFVKDIDDNA